MADPIWLSRFIKIKQFYFTAILKLKFKLEVIKEEIVNIAYAIHSYILSNEEMNIAKNIVNKENLPFINQDE